MKFAVIRGAVIVGAVFLLATAAPLYAQDDANAPADDSAGAPTILLAEEEMTDSQRDFAAAADLADVSGPIAFGVVYFNGTKQSGTSNWASSYNSTYKRYEIKISGQNYYYTKYSTVITPAGDKRFCRSSSVGGKLLVYCYDSNGAAQTSRFGFVTFKQ